MFDQHIGWVIQFFTKEWMCAFEGLFVMWCVQGTSIFLIHIRELSTIGNDISKGTVYKLGYVIEVSGLSAEYSNYKLYLGSVK